MGLKLNYFVLWEQVLKNSCSFITIGIHRGYVHLISVDLFTEQCSNVKTRQLCTEFEILGSAPQTYCSIMNCSSPLRDCDMPDECFISYLTWCVTSPQFRPEVSYFLQIGCVFWENSKTGNAKGWKLTALHRVEKSKIFTKLPNLDVSHILDHLSVMLSGAWHGPYFSMSDTPVTCDWWIIHNITVIQKWLIWEVACWQTIYCILSCICNLTFPWTRTTLKTLGGFEPGNGGLLIANLKCYWALSSSHHKNNMEYFIHQWVNPIHGLFAHAHGVWFTRYLENGTGMTNLCES